MIESDVPLGLCPKCSRPMIHANKQKICPVHGTRPDGEPSGLIVTGEDPGADAYKLIVNEKGYLERVELDDPRPPASVAELEAAQAKQLKESKDKFANSPVPLHPGQSPEGKQGTTESLRIREAVSLDVATRGLVAPPVGGVIQIPRVVEGLVTVPIKILRSFLSGTDAIDGVRIMLSDRSLNDLYEFVDHLPLPVSMKEVKVLVRLQEEIDRLLGRPQ